MKETQVAQVLGVTQSAVSKYSKRVRGTAIPIEKLPEIQTITDQIIDLLLNKPSEQKEIMILFCKACGLIRSKGLMCPICQQNQKPSVDNCDFCSDQ